MHSGPHCTHDIFSGPHLRFIRKEQNKSSSKILEENKKNKVITFAEAQFFAQNQAKSKKKVITSAGRSLSFVTAFWHVFTV